MTMDVTNRKMELKSGGEEQTQIVSNKITKRPFDVAFLMLSDDKLTQKKLMKTYEKELEIYKTTDDEDEEIEVGNNHDPSRGEYKLQKYFTQKQQIFDDPNLIKAKNLDELRGKTSSNAAEQKSAFTKVNLNRLSPNPSISPDLNYQNSLSPSPPIRNYNFPNNILSTNHLFKTQQICTYQNNFSPENFNCTPTENHFLVKASNPNEMVHSNFMKMRPMYRPDLTYSYQQFPHQELMKMSPPELKFSQDVRHPATAILTSLLPPSLAALSLPAQNVCAKCNISFRMTSDLVYHMRSHHKNDSVDFTRKRREDKLKCPVCAESFRERHHLTRHMTAHQDKEDDNVVKKKGF